MSEHHERVAGREPRSGEQGRNRRALRGSPLFRFSSKLKWVVGQLWRRLGDISKRRLAKYPGGVFERPTPSDGLVSIVLTGAGDEAAWSRASSAVLAQEHRALELIIVDASPAGVGAKVAERLRATDDRVRVLRCRRTCGDSWAFNLGLMYARGRSAAHYVAISRTIWAKVLTEGRAHILQTMMDVLPLRDRVALGRKSKNQ